MGIIDTFRKSKEAYATPPSPQEPTVADILRDKSKSHLFGKLLEREGDEELSKRVKAGTIQESDIQILEARRKIFSEKMLSAEKVEKFLTKETIINLARKNPDFQEVINVFGPDNAAKAIQARFKELSITDEDRFEAMVDAIKTAADFKNGQYKKVEEGVEKLCKEHGISQKEYTDALAIKDPAKKLETLQKLAGRNYGKFAQLKDVFSGKRAKYFDDLGRTLAGSEADFEKVIEELNDHEKNIGEVLFSTLRENDTMRNFLSAEMKGEKAPDEPKVGFKDANKGAFDQKLWDSEWDRIKRKNGYDSKSDADKETIRNKFVKEAQVYYESRSGPSWWEQIVAAMTKEFIEDKAKELK